ncbi:MAG TPA: phosphoribosyl-ATP diphosphatase [Methanolinea sp.]|nr:phosphoribosyl-ATP diphosphatase [Methanolinea sp.]MDI6899558.1 phosphoribosyl-ATP diphosphatase [Methanolinea sp.]HPC55527.1 phosphoribosyl-ATP diphosphatase [Methanolinea sp.]HQE85778.1 phosphoribosyl-ATP diphosphatase [Methanolinea sp.]HQI13630.1 phosphoribosyl-ATP diphosphatase [Methanolinea sp.]
MERSDILLDLFEVIRDRVENPRPNSYVASLVGDPKGIDRVLEKVGEETTEYILAVKNGRKDEITYEAADLVFHLMVSLKSAGVEWEEILRELASRRK